MTTVPIVVTVNGLVAKSFGLLRCFKEAFATNLDQGTDTKITLGIVRRFLSLSFLPPKSKRIIREAK